MLSSRSLAKPLFHFSLVQSVFPPTWGDDHIFGPWLKTPITTPRRLCWHVLRGREQDEVMVKKRFQLQPGQLSQLRFCQRHFPLLLIFFFNEVANVFDHLNDFQQLIMEQFMSKKSTNLTVPVFKVCFFSCKIALPKTNSSPLKMVVSNRNLLSGRVNGHPIVGRLLNRGPDWFRAFAIKCSIRRYPVGDFVGSNGVANGTRSTG